MATKLSIQEQKEILGALGQSVAAWLIGVSTRHFRDCNAPRNSDGSYNAKDLLEWRCAANSKPDDSLLAGGDSPNLERYRAAKADLAEMEAAERRGRLVDVDVFAEWWETEVAVSIRKAVEMLQARHGSEVAEVISSALRKVEPIVERRITSE